MGGALRSGLTEGGPGEDGGGRGMGLSCPLGGRPWKTFAPSRCGQEVLAEDDTRVGEDAPCVLGGVLWGVPVALDLRYAEEEGVEELLSTGWYGGVSGDPSRLPEAAGAPPPRPQARPLDRGTKLLLKRSFSAPSVAPVASACCLSKPLD